MQGGKQFVFLHVLTVHLKRTRWTRSQAKRRIWDSAMRLLWYSPAAEIRNVWILISIQSSRLKCPLFWTTMQTTRMSQHLKLIKRSTCRCNRISVISAFSLYQIFIETLRFCLAHTNTKTEKKNASLTLQTDQLISTSICNARTVALMAVIQNSRTTIGWQQKDLNPSHRAASELDSTVHQKYMTCVFLTGFPCVARIYD